MFDFLKKFFHLHSLTRVKTSQVSDEELSVRFLRHGSYVKNGRIKLDAFMPALYNGNLETSVCLQRDWDDTKLRQINSIVLKVGKCNGWAKVAVKDIREANERQMGEEINTKLGVVLAPTLDIPYHANIVNWPFANESVAFAKSRHKALCRIIAEKAIHCT